MEGNPIGNHPVHLELGKAIFGVLPCFAEVTHDQLRTAITEMYTAERWAGMNQKEKNILQIQGLGLRAITGRFGVEGNPIKNHSVHLELGKAIFGALPCFVEMTPDRLRTTITEAYTAEQWAGMKYKVKLTLKIQGLGLYALAGRFGVEGDPINKHSVHLELGKAIWGTGWNPPASAS